MGNEAILFAEKNLMYSKPYQTPNPPHDYIMKGFLDIVLISRTNRKIAAHLYQTKRLRNNTQEEMRQAVCELPYNLAVYLSKIVRGRTKVRFTNCKTGKEIHRWFKFVDYEPWPKQEDGVLVAYPKGIIPGLPILE